MVSGTGGGNRIRELRRDDMYDVCRLYERLVRSGGTVPPPAVVSYFERTLLDHPWRDDDIPSLVYESRDGEILGFVGSYVRRFRMDGRRLRLACSGQLVAAPGGASGGAGALLVRRFLAGPQDITITDGATDYVRRVWTGLGGYTRAAASIGWAKVLRPGQVVRFVSDRYVRMRGVDRLARVAGPVLDALARRILGRRAEFMPHVPDSTTEVLSPEGLVEHVQDAARRLRFWPDYDVEFARWLFTELDAVSFRGTPIRRVVVDPGGRKIGWYVYYLAQGGLAQVLQVAAPDRDVGPVLDNLFWHAHRHGAAAVLGRVEPSLVGELPKRRCIFVPTDWSLVHTHHSDVAAVLETPQTLLSRLEGEWWMGHHSLLLREGAGSRPATAVP